MKRLLSVFLIAVLFLIAAGLVFAEKDKETPGQKLSSWIHVEKLSGFNGMGNIRKAAAAELGLSQNMGDPFNREYAKLFKFYRTAAIPVNMNPDLEGEPIIIIVVFFLLDNGGKLIPMDTPGKPAVYPPKGIPAIPISFLGG